MNADYLVQSQKLPEDSGLIQIIAESLKRSALKFGDADHATPREITADAFQSHKEDSRFLFMSAKNTLATTSQLLAGKHIGYGLFDKDCCLLRVFGSQDFIGWCEEKGIRPGTLWNEETLGTNCIGLGIAHHTNLSTVGEENFGSFLHDAALHFAVIQLESILGNNTLFGGIAIMCSKECNSDILPILCASNAREISLMVFSHKSSVVYSNIGDSALLSIDQSSEKNQVIFSTDNLFWPFGMAPKDLSFSNLEDIVNPLPANKAFWDVVNSRRTVNDMSIRLQTKFGNVTVSMSASPFDEDLFNFKGINLFFLSSTRIKDIINKYSSQKPSFTFENIICQDIHFYDVVQYAKAAATSETNILIIGESGTGKDVIAQAIHNESIRSDGPFVALNCAAFSKELISSEIFGYEEGAFTGAKKGGAMGKFELANNGTLFLDEIGDMPLDLQAALLRVIENQVFMKVGGNHEIKVNVRIIAATNQNLFEKIQQRLFREDLFYRIGVIRINVPPLRERTDDILPLSEYFIEKISLRIGKEKPVLTDAAKRYLIGYEWPGNVRELKNLYDGILNIYDGPTITNEQLSQYLKYNTFQSVLTAKNETTNPMGRISPKQLTKSDILCALKECNGNKVETAGYLGISRRTLYRKLLEYNLI